MKEHESTIAKHLIEQFYGTKICKLFNDDELVVYSLITELINIKVVPLLDFQAAI